MVTVPVASPTAAGSRTKFDGPVIVPSLPIPIPPLIPILKSPAIVRSPVPLSASNLSHPASNPVVGFAPVTLAEIPKISLEFP